MQVEQKYNLILTSLSKILSECDILDFNISNVPLNYKLSSLNLDNIETVEATMAFEETFGLEISENIFDEVETLKGLADNIYKRVHGTDYNLDKASNQDSLKIQMFELPEKNKPKVTMNSRRIWVTFKRSGFHCYPGAPVDVDYLQSRHRHLFGFKVTIDVAHANREIEFHQFLNWLESLYDTKTLELSNKSCEMMADDLYAHIERKYGSERFVQIEVSEDGECGCVNTYRQFKART
jgi:acyl carrier protein